MHNPKPQWHKPSESRCGCNIIILQRLLNMKNYEVGFVNIQGNRLTLNHKYKFRNFIYFITFKQNNRSTVNIAFKTKQN